MSDYDEDWNNFADHQPERGKMTPMGRFGYDKHGGMINHVYFDPEISKQTGLLQQPIFNVRGVYTDEAGAREMNEDFKDYKPLNEFQPGPNVIGGAYDVERSRSNTVNHEYSHAISKEEFAAAGFEVGAVGKSDVVKIAGRTFPYSVAVHAMIEFEQQQYYPREHSTRTDVHYEQQRSKNLDKVLKVTGLSKGQFADYYFDLIKVLK